MSDRSTAPIQSRLLSFADAAAYMGFSERQLRRWKEQHKLEIPFVPVMGRNYFERATIDAYLDSLPRVLATETDTRVTRSSSRKRAPTKGVRREDRQHPKGKQRKTRKRA